MSHPIGDMFGAVLIDGWKKPVLKGLGLVLLILCTSFITRACSSTKVIATASVQTVVEQQESPTSEQAIEAMFRGHPSAKKLCYDAKQDNYYIYWIEPAAREGMFSGWYYTPTPTFYPSGNGTWFILEIPDNKYSQIYPDVTGLPCRER